jgi:glutamyl-tRNA(Gln) amidotransferase subunit D
MAASYKVGDIVSVKTKDAEYEGIVMPTPEAEKDVLTIKLPSGYNLGLKLTKNVSVKKLGTGESPKAIAIKPPIKKSLPSIVVIATGGTITSKVDYTTGGVSPLSKPEELLLATPELLEVVNIKRIEQPFTIFSEDMTPNEWQIIAKEVAKALNESDVSGVIVTHGTDTLHYTAAALSFMLENLNKPVALVGGQRSSDRGSFDGGMNLICAAHYCKSHIAEVAIVMHGNSADTFCLASRGVNVRKMHSSRRDTFRPINELPLAKIWPTGKIEILNKNHKDRNDKLKVTADAKFEEKIALIKFFPGADPEILQHLIDKKYKGIIIEATGLGHVATNPIDKKKSWLPTIKSAVEKGIFIGFTPQTIYGSLNPYVYSSARELLNVGVCYLGNMLSETAYVKLGKVLAYARNHEEAKKWMLTNFAGEIVQQISPETFLY